MNDVILYDKNGRECGDDSRVFAKVIKTIASTRYFILTENNAPYNPMGVSSNRENILNLVFKQTNSEAVGWYIKYLQTNNLIYFTRTNRSFFNG